MTRGDFAFRSIVNTINGSPIVEEPSRSIVPYRRFSAATLKSNATAVMRNGDDVPSNVMAESNSTRASRSCARSSGIDTSTSESGFVRREYAM